MLNYNRKNWYWSVAGNPTQVYSSASASYVSVSDTTYAAWCASGGVATPIDADGMLLMRIDILEDSVTPRMSQEANAGSSNTFSGGPYEGKTSAQAIAIIVAAKDALRAQLS